MIAEMKIGPQYHHPTYENTLLPVKCIGTNKMYYRLIRIAGSATHIAMRYRINVTKQEALN